MTSTHSVVALQVFGGLVIAVVSALLSAWFTVKLSLPKFRQERLWDRKAAAYERIIEAFHKSKKFSSEHINAKSQNSDVVEDRDKVLCRLYSEAQEEISRAADIGSFTLIAYPV